MRLKEYDAILMFLRFLYPCNLFQLVKITTTYFISRHSWNHIIWYTRWPGYVDLDRDALYPEPAHFSAAFCTLEEPESMSEWHLSVTFFAAGILRSCQSALVRAMLMRAGIVRDYVWATLIRATHFRATLVRATLSEPRMSQTISDHTFIARIVRDYVRATLVRATLVRATSIRPGLSDHIRATLVTVGWWWISGSVALPVS